MGVVEGTRFCALLEWLSNLCCGLNIATEIRQHHICYTGWLFRVTVTPNWP